MHKTIRTMTPMLALMLLMAACAPVRHTASIDRADASLNLAYAPKGGGGLAGRTIGIQNLVFNARQQEPGLNRARLYAMAGGSYRQPPMMDNALRTALARAYGRDLEAIVTARGGKVAGPFASYEEIPFGQKERMLLLVEPQLEIQVLPVTRKEEDSSLGAAHEEWGVYRVRATGVFKFREPLTNESIMVKRVNVEVESEPYHYAYKTETGGDGLIMGVVHAAATADFKEHDDRLKRRNEAISRMYAKLMAAVDAALDPREIALHEAEIERLKRIKRY